MTAPNLDTPEKVQLWAAGHHEKCEQRHTNQEEKNTVTFDKLKTLGARVRKLENYRFWMLGVFAAVSFIGAIAGSAIAASFRG